MPTIEEALQIGWRHHQAGDLRNAEHVYRQVLLVAPSNENAWCFLGMACHDQGRFEEAVQAYYQALNIKRNFPVALSNLGNTLKQQGLLSDAEASCREALRYKPDYSTAYNNLGVVLVAQGRLHDAAASFEKALQLMPNDAVAHANLGAALVRQGRFDEGTANAQQALRINPNYAEAHKNQAIVSLLLGQFEKGWPEYEWRWKCPGSALPAVHQPRWNGEPVDGRSILLHWEQGLGDTIHFIRYARWFQRQGARVVVCCQKPLFKLLQRCEGIDQLVAQGEPLPDVDFWTPLLSIPGVLQTELASIPDECGYLSADPQLVELWRDRLQQYPGYRIGIAWQGSPDFHADRQRSVPLKCFAPLARLPGVRLISLQKGPGAEQIDELRGAFEVIRFDDMDTTHGPFMDTAALMTCVDRVITSDTSVPHLAGALGVPVWMGLTISPDWRWLLERDDSPWYPSMRMFRQRTLGDWEEVFERIATELAPQIPEGLVVQGAAEPPPHSEPAVVSVTPAAPAVAPPADPRVVADTGFNVLLRARHGYMLFNRHDMYIGRSLEVYGEFSEAETEVFAKLLSPGDVVVECGANIGTHTVPLARMVGERGMVFAFEPQRLVFQLLCANVALNSLSQVHCRAAAVGAAPGEILVPQLNPNTAMNFGGLGLGAYTKGESVPVVTIDSLNLDNCRLIKIDVEGMEELALRGAADSLRRCRPFLYVENDRQEHSAMLIEYILSFGYEMYWHTPRLFCEKNYYGRAENVFANIVSVNMLCVPSGGQRPGDIEGLRPITSPHSRWNG